MISKMTEAAYKFKLAEVLEKYTDNFASGSRQLTFDSGRGFYLATIKQDGTFNADWILAEHCDKEMFERTEAHEQLGEFVRTYDPYTQYVLWLDVVALGTGCAWCIPHRNKDKEK